MKTDSQGNNSRLGPHCCIGIGPRVQAQVGADGLRLRVDGAFAEGAESEKVGLTHMERQIFEYVGAALDSRSISSAECQTAGSQAETRSNFEGQQSINHADQQMGSQTGVTFRCAQKQADCMVLDLHCQECGARINELSELHAKMPMPLHGAHPHNMKEMLTKTQQFVLALRRSFQHAFPVRAYLMYCRCCSQYKCASFGQPSGCHFDARVLIAMVREFVEVSLKAGQNQEDSSTVLSAIDSSDSLEQIMRQIKRLNAEQAEYNEVGSQQSMIAIKTVPDTRPLICRPQNKVSSLNIKIGEATSEQAFYKIKNGRRYVSDRFQENRACFSIERFNLTCKDGYQDTNKVNGAHNYQRNHSERDLMSQTMQERYSSRPAENYRRSRQRTQMGEILHKNKKPSKKLSIELINPKPKKQSRLSLDSKQNAGGKQQKIMNKLQKAKGKSPFHDGGTAVKKPKIRWDDIQNMTQQINKKLLATQESLKVSSNEQSCQAIQNKQINNQDVNNNSTVVIEVSSTPKNTRNSIHIELNQSFLPLEAKPQAPRSQKFSDSQQKIAFNSPKKQQNKPKQIDSQSQLPEAAWTQIQNQILAKINPIGETINDIKQLFRRQNYKGLIELYLLYKKFFYMRASLYSSLMDQDEPLLPSLSLPQWKQVCSSQLHSTKLRQIQDQNQAILATLHKMNKKVTEKEKNIAKPQILAITIDDEQIYNKFVATTFQLSIARLKDAKQSCTKAQQGQSILKYGEALLLAGLDEVPEDKYELVCSWVEEGVNAKRSYPDLLRQLEQLQGFITQD